MYKTFKILKPDFDNIFSESGRRILKAIKVKAASLMRKKGGLPVKDKLTIRSGGLARELQNDNNVDHRIEENGTVSEKHLLSKNAYLLTDVKHPITTRQKALFRRFSAFAKDPIWRDYWGRMGSTSKKGAKFLYGRGHVENAIENMTPGKMMPIINEEFNRVFPKTYENVEL